MFSHSCAPEQQENFLLQSQICVLTLIRCQFHPRNTAVACKRPGHSAKSTGGRLHLNKHTPLTWWSQSWLTMPLSRHSMGTIQETAHTQLIRKHWVTVISACWATVDWSWPKSGISVLKLISTSEKKRRKLRMNCWTFSQNPYARRKSHHHHCCQTFTWQAHEWWWQNKAF